MQTTSTKSWTKIKINAYVPPGYMDSGWQEMDLFVTAVTDKPIEKLRAGEKKYEHSRYFHVR